MTEPQSELHHIAATRAARAREQSEAAPRNARLHFSALVTGAGESRLDGSKALKFGTLLMDEPAFTWGAVSTGPVPKGAVPVASAIVLRWIKGANGLYAGAELGFRIQSSQQRVALRFTLVFEGVALRSTAGVTSSLGDNSAVNLYTGA